MGECKKSEMSGKIISFFMGECKKSEMSGKKISFFHSCECKKVKTIFQRELKFFNKTLFDIFFWSFLEDATKGGVVITYTTNNLYGFFLKKNNYVYINILLVV